MKREDIIEKIENLRTQLRDDTVRPDTKDTVKTWIKHYKQRLIDKDYEI